MSIPPPKHQSMPSVETAFYQALDEASNTFLANIDYVVIYDDNLPTGVAHPNLLNINFTTQMPLILLPALGNLKEAWLLVLAHEAGHLGLNAKCLQQGASTSEPNAQLTAIGLNTNDPLIKNAADFQKETAIEAYCDICLALESLNIAGEQWREPIKLLRNHRALVSKSLGLLTPDEYATHPALDMFLNLDGKLDPMTGARIALEESALHTSSLKKISVAGAVGLSSLKSDLVERITKWRNKRQSSNQQAPTQKKNTKL